MANANYVVSTFTDLQDALAAISFNSANSRADRYTITFAAGATIEQTANLAAINMEIGDTLEIRGQGAALDGDDAYRGLYVYQGEVTIRDLLIEHSVAQGDAGVAGGGGAAGLGGGLFVGEHAGVTLINTDFDGNRAVGGDGGYSDYAPGTAGVGVLGDGGDAGRDATSYEAGGNGGDGGFGAGGGGGGTGGQPYTTYNSSSSTTSWPSTSPSTTSFSRSVHAFGGTHTPPAGQGGAGGFGAGDGAHGRTQSYFSTSARVGGGGGGGLGAGGDIFVQAGGRLTIVGGALNGSAFGGAGHDGGGDGSGFGGGIFIFGETDVSLGAEYFVTTVNSQISDVSGRFDYRASGSGSLVIGAGTVALNAFNTFVGGITLGSATLLVGTNGALGFGDVTINGVAAEIGFAAGVGTQTNVISGMDRDDSLHFFGFSSRGATVVRDTATSAPGAQQYVLTNDAGEIIRFTLADQPGERLKVHSDGIGGSIVAFASNVPGATSRADYLSGTSAQDIVTLDAGNDVYRGRAGDDRLYGDDGDDRLFGDEGNDLLVGGSGADTLDGGTGRDEFYGEAGRDRITIHETPYRVDGGAGNDQLTIADHAVITFFEGQITGIERIAVETGADLDFSAYSYSLATIGIDAGLDLTRVIATQGNDVIRVDDGRYAIDGQGGDDVIIIASLNNSSVVGGAGDDTLIVRGSGNASIDFDVSVAGFEHVTLASAGSYSFAASAMQVDDIRITTRAGQQVSLVATGFNDRIAGGGGDDSITGGDGADRISGGAGSDVFVFNSLAEMSGSSGALDRITDFSHADRDQIDLSMLGDPDTGQAYSFSFIGSGAFSGQGTDAEVRTEVLRNGTILVQIDVNHDAVADGSFYVSSATPLAANDFNFIP